MTDILNKTLVTKAEEVATQEAVASVEEIKRQAQVAAPVRNFIDAICAKRAQGLPTVIVEIGKASPSKKLIRADFCPAAITTAYGGADVTCLSVLTDEPCFQGLPEYLK